jgi:transposase
MTFGVEDPMGDWIAISALDRVRSPKTPTLEATMQLEVDGREPLAVIQTDLRAVFVSLELSRSSYLMTSLSPGAGEKMSKHSVLAGDIAGLLARLEQLTEKARARTGRNFPIIVIQEAGLDGFWIHRVLQSKGIESHVVDAASILVSRRLRRVKTDRIDGETLVRTLLAYKRGEPRVCSMVKTPTAEEEDRRRICRERKTLLAERVEHVNRVKGLLFAQGIFDYEPLNRDRRTRLEALATGDGRPLPVHLKAQISREFDRLEIVLTQLKAIEAERDVLLASVNEETPTPAAMLLQLKGIGSEVATVLWSEALFRSFDNRRQVAAYAGLAPTPWQSGSVNHEQGVSKGGNPRLRTAMLQLSWLWLRHQAASALSLWFHERIQRNSGKMRKTMIIALARKLLVALWKYATRGVVIEGAVMKGV